MRARATVRALTRVTRVALEDSVGSEHTDGVDGMGVVLCESHDGRIRVSGESVSECREGRKKESERKGREGILMVCAHTASVSRVVYV